MEYQYEKSMEKSMEDREREESERQYFGSDSFRAFDYNDDPVKEMSTEAQMDDDSDDELKNPEHYKNK